MPVRKYRTIEEMNRDDEWVLKARDPVRSMKELSAWARTLVPSVPWPGVRKFRSIGLADEDRRLWEQACIEKGTMRPPD